MKLFSTIAQYVVLIAIAFFCFRGCDWHHLHAPRLTIHWYMIVPFALSMAYVWVDVLKWGVVKPFNCITCLTGWFSLILAALAHVTGWYLYVFLGVFVGSVYSSIKMRWL